LLGYKQLNPEGMMVLYAPRDAIYDDVVTVLDVLRSVGGDRVALATVPTTGQPSGIPSIPGMPSTQQTPVVVPNPGAIPTTAPTLRPGGNLPVVPIPGQTIPTNPQGIPANPQGVPGSNTNGSIPGTSQLTPAPASPGASSNSRPQLPLP